MPGLSGTPHHGRRRHARMVAETTYGAVPGGASWSAVPYIGDGFKLKAEAEAWDPDSNYGGAVDSAVAIQHKQDVSGQLVTALWPQRVAALLDAALDRTGDTEDLTSYAWQHYTPVETRQIVGAVVRSLRLQVNRTDQADAQLTLDWLAQAETTVAGVDTDDFDYSDIDQRPFMGCDVAQIEVESADSFDVEQFTLEVTNELEAGPYYPMSGVTHRVLRYIIAGGRTISLDLTRVNRSAQLNDALRAGADLSFYTRWTHPLGHSLEIRLPRLIVPRVEEDGTPSRVARETPRLEARATAVGGDAIQYGVDLATGGTTTIGPYTTTAEPTTTTTA